MNRCIARIALVLLLAGCALAARAQLRPSTPEEAALDAAAFERVERGLADTFTDIQSVVVTIGGRVAYAFFRDGAPDKLRDQQSAEKSALCMLVGIALGQGRIASLDQPVLALVPEWASLNADPRAATITVRHLLTLTAGFAVNDVRGSARFMAARDAWARPLASAPGERFAYDNAMVPLLSAVLEQATGMPLPDYARRHLVGPLAMAEPSYGRTLHLRTLDMAKLGQLALRKGAWGERQLLPADYVAAATRPQTGGGPPVDMPYGFLWWSVPMGEPGSTFMASGWAGQLIWVHAPLHAVIAMTSTVSPQSQQRGHTVRLLRGGLLAAVEARRER